MSSPLLANLFLHYAFDMWMGRTFPYVPFERYADDAICHCKSAEEARALRAMYQHIVVEAENLEAACTKTISDDIDWDTQEMDCDSARATTITAAKIVRAGNEADQAHRLIIASSDPRDLPLDMLSLAGFLYEDEA